MNLIEVSADGQVAQDIENVSCDLPDLSDVPLFALCRFCTGPAHISQLVVFHDIDNNGVIAHAYAHDACLYVAREEGRNISDCECEFEEEQPSAY